MKTTHAVRAATAADIPSIGDASGRAFIDDPSIAWAIPDRAKREKELPGFFEVMVRSLFGNSPNQKCLTVDGRAVALWQAPGEWKIPVRAQLKMAGPMVRRLGLRTTIRYASALAAIEKRHPTELHWHLALLATAPELQRKGIGGALLQPVLEICDREGLGAYLETETIENVAFYSRFGFEVTDEFPIAKDGPTVWLMWRNPR